MVNLTADISQAMSVILAFTNKVGMFGITLTAWIVLFMGIEWSVSLIQKIGKRFIPGAEYWEGVSQEALEWEEFNHERDHEAWENKAHGRFDPDNDEE